MVINILMRIVLLNIIILITLLPFYTEGLSAQQLAKESIAIGKNEKQEYFYDTLKVRASRKKITRWFFDLMITPPRPYVNKKESGINYFRQMEGKTISNINIKALAVFGPTFQDTTKKENGFLERTANLIHTKSNLKTIRKMLMFGIGDTINPALLYENERLIRSLPYIKEIKILLNQDSVNTNMVDVTILTKDRFSFGATGELNSTSSAALGLYNQNIFGIGHEISVRFVGHLNKQPYLGIESYYKVNNINGRFIDMSFGYLNTYRNEGFKYMLMKKFYTPTVKWAYGANALRIYHSDRIFKDDPIVAKDTLNLLHLGAWGGRSFQINNNTTGNAQIVLSGGINFQRFYMRPKPGPYGLQYFANNLFLLSGITFSQRRYVQDELVYSYGIVEDIPEGFKNEIVYGYNFNEFGNHHYAHILLSNGNLLINRSGYLYLEGDVGGYFNRHGYQQGLLNARIYFISKQIHAGRKRFRLFTRADYTLGVSRFGLEQLTLNGKESIRGFSSRKVYGTQRLRLKAEYVLFLRKDFYKFNIALFGFGDIGIIGTSKKIIFTQNYYTGFGAGIRIHNENLVFKTMQLRLALYPFHPSDMPFMGAMFEEQSKRQFYSFEPTQPEPIDFR